jgi:hypothetical protein
VYSYILLTTKVAEEEARDLTLRPVFHPTVHGPQSTVLSPD